MLNPIRAWSYLQPVRKAIVVLLLVVGLLGVAIGAYYLNTKAHHLPSFFPGYAPEHTKLHAVRHGIAALGLGIVLLVAAWLVCSLQVDRRSTRSRAW